MEEIPITNRPSQDGKVLERADEVLLEGRDRVSKLRVEAKQGEDRRRQLLYAGRTGAGIHGVQQWPSSVFRNQWIQSSMMMHTASDKKRL